MPQFATYPPISTLAAADLLLASISATGAVNAITAQNLATAIGLLSNDNVKVIFSSANLVLTAANQMVVGVSGAPISWTLPATNATAALVGKKFYLTNTGAGTVTVNRTGSDTIAGITSLAIAQNKSYLLISDGSGNYAVFSN